METSTAALCENAPTEICLLTNAKNSQQGKLRKQPGWWMLHWQGAVGHRVAQSVFCLWGCYASVWHMASGKIVERIHVKAGMFLWVIWKPKWVFIILCWLLVPVSFLLSQSFNNVSFDNILFVSVHLHPPCLLFHLPSLWTHLEK